MNTIEDHHLSNQEKTLIAMGAAMGAGCRTCADKLYDIALSLHISSGEMLQAFSLGLEAKAQAVRTMQDKVAELIRREDKNNIGKLSPDLSSMIRMSSFVAANSAPDCYAEMIKSVPGKITVGQAQLCIATGKMVRQNAMGFSDREISAKFSGDKSEESGVCCPAASGGTKNASACSCS